MSDYTIEEIIRGAELMGVAPADLAALRSDTALQAQMLAALRQSGPNGAATPSLDPAAGMGTQFEAARAAYEREKNRPPRRVPASDRDEIVRRADEMRRAAMHKQPYQLSWTYLGLPKSSSKRQLDELQPIRFREMKATKTHKGRYLLCRIISVPSAEHVSIYNLDLHGMQSGPDLDAFFPRGTVLVVREPTFKPNQNATTFLVRADSPTDVEFLPSNHPLVKSAKWATSPPVKPPPPDFDFKALGNMYFGARKDLLAAKVYGDGIAATTKPEQRLVLALNRALAHLRLGNYASAYRDTSTVLSYLGDDIVGPPNAAQKAMLRRAKALEGARLLARAAEEYRRISIFDFDNEEAVEAKKRVDRMLEVSRTGVYDWRELEEWGEKTEWTEGPAVGDYIGPVKIVEIKERSGGRGVVATRDIKAGELLLVEKAFAVGKGDLHRTIMGYNFKNNGVATSSRLALVSRIIAKIRDDPATATLLNSLYGGDDFPPSGRFEFGALQDRPLAFDETFVFADIDRIEDICTHNAITLRGLKIKEFPGGEPSGLFLGCSMFNHECVPNAEQTIYADVRVIRARAPIKAGEEISVAYVALDATPETRADTLGPHFRGGECPCTYCRRTERTAALRRRKFDEIVGAGSEWDKAHRALQTRSVKTVSDMRRERALFQKGLRKLEAVYPPDHGPIKSELFTALHELAEVSPYDEANDLDIRAFESVGAVFRRTKTGVEVVAAPVAQKDEVLAGMLMLASRLAIGLGRQTEGRHWVKAAAQMSKIMYGDDYSRFCERQSASIQLFHVETLIEACRP
ncbi:hypothetical protein JCM10450v2_000365 [Rhodotorula kratochvilovae]